MSERVAADQYVCKYVCAQGRYGNRNTDGCRQCAAATVSY